MAKNTDFVKNSAGFIRQRVSKKLFLAAQRARLEALDEVGKSVIAHPVSRALMSGSDDLMPKPGTLFGLMGFREGRKPVQELSAFLKGSLAFKLILRRESFSGGSGVIGRMIGPSEEDFVEAGITTDEWNDNRSWPDVIETRVPGLSKYLAKDGYGRSKEGFQVKNRKVWETDELKEMPYLTPIFRKFKKTFREKLLIYANL